MPNLKIWDETTQEWKYVSHGVSGDTGIQGATGITGATGVVGATSEIVIQEGLAPSTPASGWVSLYAKDNGQLFIKDDLGTEKLVTGYSDGWTPIGVNPVYVSATSIKFTGIDLTSVFPVGTKLKLTQTTIKYFYVTAVAFSTDTTLTVTGGSDYTIANAAITEFYYSHGLAFGFPEWFDWTPTSYSGFSTNPSQTMKFSLNGRTVSLTLYLVSSGTSNGTGFEISLPIQAGSSASIKYIPIRFHDNGSTSATWGMGLIAPNSSNIVLYASPSGIGFTASGSKGAWFEGFYEI